MFKYEEQSERMEACASLLGALKNFDYDKGDIQSKIREAGLKIIQKSLDDIAKE